MLITQSGTYTLTGDVVGGIVIQADNVVLDLNGFTVRGDGTGMGIVAVAQSNVTVRNGTVTGFEQGVRLSPGYEGETGNVVANMKVFDCGYMGVQVGGTGATVTATQVWDIGGTDKFAPSFAIGVYGRNAVIENCRVWDIHGSSESCGFGFNGADNTGGVIRNSISDGTGSTGWGFGVWNSAGPVNMISCTVIGWDEAIGAAGPVFYQSSVLRDVGRVAGTPVGTSNVVTLRAADDGVYVFGTPGMDRLIGGDGDNTLVGLGGLDHMLGNGGADTFLFLNANGGRVSIADFIQGQDTLGFASSEFVTDNLQIGTSALGSDPTFVFDRYRKVLMYDVDGQGGRAAMDVAYLPQATMLHPSDLRLVDVPKALLAPINEDTVNPAGGTVSSLFGHLSGGSLAGVAVVANAATSEGSWQYSTGGAWITISSVSESTALLLDGGAGLRFVPAANFNGSAPLLMVHLIEGSAGGVAAGMRADLNVTGVGAGTPFDDSLTLLGQHVASVNDIPVTRADGAVTVRFATVTGNTIAGSPGRDADADGDTLVIAGVTGTHGRGVIGAALPGRYGTLTLNADGSFSYIADRGESLAPEASGYDVFVYTVSDQNGGTASATLTFLVKGSNVGSAGFDRMTATAGIDIYSGLGGNDTFTGFGGNDYFDGGPDLDVSVYTGARSQYMVRTSLDGQTHQVTDKRPGSPDGIDVLRNVELLQFSDGVFTTASARTNEFYSMPGWTAVSGDYNGDGHADLLWKHDKSGSLGVWLMRDGQIQSTLSAGNMLGWTAAAGDFNGDGTDDLLWMNDKSGTVGVWLMQDGRVASSIALPAMSGWSPVSGDFNGDGTDDLLWKNDKSGTVGVWLMQDGRIASTIGITSMPGWSAAAGDFNGDGTDDLLWKNDKTGAIGLWLMQDGRIAGTVALNNMPGWTLATVADFNGDGTDDLLWKNPGGSTGVWLMDSGRLAGSVDVGSTKDLRFVAAGDFDNNGVDDMFWQSQNGILSEWLLF